MRLRAGDDLNRIPFVADSQPSAGDLRGFGVRCLGIVGGSVVELLRNPVAVGATNRGKQP